MKYFLLFICYFALESSADVASFIDPCVSSDEKCILQSSIKALDRFRLGDPEHGIPPASPLILSDVTADTEELKLKFKNIHVVGLEKSELIKVSRDAVKSKVSLVADLPVTATGQYLLGGKLGPLAVEGDGDFEIKSAKVRISLDVDMIPFEKNGEKYYKLSKFDYKYDPIERFYIKLDNLYNGDKKKAEPLLEILNLSWKDLISQIGKPVIDAIITKEFTVINDFIKGVPANKLEKIE